MGFAEEVIKNSAAYIEQSAEYASKYFAMMKIQHDFFGDTKMALTPENCEILYQDMIRDLVKTKKPVVCRFGLFAAMNPMRTEDQTIIVVYLGVSFPDPANRE